jgi:hypothetical protein
MRKSAFRRRACALASLALALADPAASIDAVVGDGTSASCTESAFDAGLGEIALGGGTLSFDCGPLPHTIVLTAEKPLYDVLGSSLAQVDGGGRITLSGGNSTRLFTIPDQANARLTHLTLAHGAAATGGAIEVAGIDGNPLTELVLERVTIRDSAASDGGGALAARNAEIFVVDSRFVDNRADGASGGGGGAVRLERGQLIVSRTEFARNRALGGNGGGAEVRNAQSSFVDCRIEGNEATTAGPNPGRGGGLHFHGDAGGNPFVLRSFIVGNQADEGGGIQATFGADLRLEHSIVEGNSAGLSGPGGGLSVFDGASAYVTAVTFVRNRANRGSGVANDATLELENVTFSENEGLLAGIGAGLLNSGDAKLFDVTFYANRGVQGGALADYSIAAEGDAVSLRNVLFVGNVATQSGASCHLEGNAFQIAHSVWPDSTCGGSSTGSNQPGTVVALEPLGWSCSATGIEFSPTHALPPGASAAVDAGACDAAETIFDQRGVERPQGAACDVGAYERSQPSCRALFRDDFERGTLTPWSRFES